MQQPISPITKRHERAVQDVTRAYEEVSRAFANAAQVEQYWLARLQEPEERLSVLERLDRFFLGEPGTNSLYGEMDALIDWFRRN